MHLKFLPEQHKYLDLLDEENKREWVSATSFISKFKQPFEADKIALKCSKNKKSKWYGMTPEEIKAHWEKESSRAITLGTWYHNQRETDICEVDTIRREDIDLKIFRPIEKDGIKYSPSQILEEGIYPEHLVYLLSAGICGQSDLVEVINGFIHITDYKTNKEIKLESFKSWDGSKQKMQHPINHLDDCNFIHYALQLSLYLYIILKHNPKLKPGRLKIQHVIFKEQDRDKFDNPIPLLDSEGNPIVDEIIEYDVPYLRKEIISLIHWLEDHGKTI